LKVLQSVFQFRAASGIMIARAPRTVQKPVKAIDLHAGPSRWIADQIRRAIVAVEIVRVEDFEQQ
jgi:hypothetical protein